MVEFILSPRYFIGLVVFTIIVMILVQNKKTGDGRELQYQFHYLLNNKGVDKKSMPTLNASTCVLDFDWKQHRMSVLESISIRTELFQITDELYELEAYDFIVVGIGSAGSTLVANLLKSNPSLRILVIEAGKPVTKPVVCFTSTREDRYSSEHNCPIHSVPQKNSNNRVLNFFMGCGPGGGSLINAMTWVRGDRNDYDDWADACGDDGWNFDSLLPLFKQIESYYPVGSDLRGTNGPIQVSRNFTKHEDSEKFRDIIASLGYQKNEDHNSETMFGVSETQMNRKHKNIGNQGLRQDAFSTQLRDLVGMDNLHILTETKVDRIVLDENTKDVQYVIFENDGNQYKVRANFEVILSAGAIHSPSILQRSGIGNCDELAVHGIKCMINKTAVGILQDHFAFSFWPKFKPDATRPTKFISSHLFDGLATIANQQRTKPKFQIEANYESKEQLHAEDFPFNIVTLHPTSRGSVKLRSNNVNDQPLVDTNHLGTEADIKQALEGFRLGIKYAKALEKMGIYDDPKIANMSDSEALQWIHNSFYSYNHFCGTCKMGRIDDEMAVVDSKLRVIGVNGLRVVDASIMPEVTSGNTNYPTMTIGAKAAQILTQEYSGLK